MRRVGTRQSMVVLTMALVGLIQACNDSPTQPALERDEPGQPDPGVQLVLIDDTTSILGTLVDSFEFHVDTINGYVEQEDTLWFGAPLDGQVIYEITSEIVHDGRTIPAREVLHLGQDSIAPDTTAFVQFYRSNGDLMRRRIETMFFPFGGIEDVILSQMGSTVFLRDTRATADNERRLFFESDPVVASGYNANNSPPPTCAFSIGSVCYPPPPFDSANTSDTNPHGIIRVRVFEIVPEDTIALTLASDSTAVTPWLPELTVNTRLQEAALGGIAPFSVTVYAGSTPLTTDVDVWAEWLDTAGGHAHTTQIVRFDEITSATDSFPNRRPFFGDLVGKPWTGFLIYQSTDYRSFEATTSAGALDFEFQAGAIGGTVNVIAQTEVSGVVYADTVAIDVRVAGLVDARATQAVTGVYWVGGTTIHPQGSNWFMTPSAAAGMQVIIDSMAVHDAGSGYYLQHNDASLSMGGAFAGGSSSLLTLSGGQTIDFPLASHTSHAIGIDVDLGLCYTTTTEYHASVPQPNRVGPDCSTTKAVTRRRLERYSARQDACVRVHNGDHFHIRFAGACVQ